MGTKKSFEFKDIDGIVVNWLNFIRDRNNLALIITLFFIAPFTTIIFVKDYFYFWCFKFITHGIAVAVAFGIVDASEQRDEYVKYGIVLAQSFLTSIFFVWLNSYLPGYIWFTTLIYIALWCVLVYVQVDLYIFLRKAYYKFENYQSQLKDFKSLKRNQNV